MTIVSKVILSLIIAVWSFNASAKCNQRFVSNLIKNMEKSGIDVPACPENTSMLPETAPIAAISISDSNGYSTGGRDGAGRKLALDLIDRTVKASGDLMPKVLFFGSKNTLADARDQIKAMDISKEQKQKAIESLIHVSEKGYLWQQDYFETYVDKRGKVVVRSTEGYFDATNSRAPYVNTFNELSSEIKKCGFKIGQPLKGEKNSSYRSGRSGGNLEALPGGLCVVGTNHFKDAETVNKYADEVCGTDLSNRLIAPTTWLRIGHTDEILKVVKNNKEKSPCNFSIALASPNKALELLAANKDKPFIDATGLDEKAADDKIRRRGGDGLIKYICKKSKELKNSKKEENKILEPAKKKKTTTEYKWMDWFIKKAYAETLPGVDNDISYQMVKNRKCGLITNGEVLEVLQTVPAYKESYKLIEEKMDLFSKQISEKLKKKLPQCGNTDFIKIPSLFYADFVEGNEKEGTKNELVKYDGVSILPNTVNSLPILNTIVFPEPDNVAFKDYLKEQMAKRGVKSEFVDSYETVHFGLGNLHCGTNTFQICKPKSLRSRFGLK